MQNLTHETAVSLLSATQVQEPKANGVKSEEKLNKIAKDFEAVFLSEMLKPMFEGIEVDDTFGGGKGEEIFRGMMLQEYGKELAEKDITGIQTQVKNKLLEAQAERTAQHTNAAPLPQNAQIIDAQYTEYTNPVTQDQE